MQLCLFIQANNDLRGNRKGYFVFWFFKFDFDEYLFSIIEAKIV